MKNKLIIISGPTASGKTSTSIQLAKHISHTLKRKVSIINFDSLLFYQELSIGTAKPTAIEMSNIPHYLVGTSSINTPLNAAQYIKDAEAIIRKLHQDNEIVILVGGSAFYLRALLKGMYESASTDDQIKKEATELLKNSGISPIIDFLKVHDPDVFKYLHENDHYRLVRAYEHFKSTGTKISEQKKLLDENDPYDLSKINHPWDILHFYLDLDKELHQKLIRQRTKTMFELGLENEVRALLNQGFDPQLKPLQSIGYKETIDYIRGNYSTLDDCIERIVISTRQLAKSQRTFFKKIHPKTEVNPLLDQQKILEITESFL